MTARPARSSESESSDEGWWLKVLSWVALAIFVAGNGPAENVVSTERAGAFIGELAVLDPAPRSAGLRAGKSGVRVLRLDGEAFNYALKAEPSIASHVIRTLAQRHRRRESKK